MPTRSYPLVLISVAAATVAIWAYCRPRPEPQPEPQPDPLVDECTKPDNTGQCDTHGCGTNSPVVNGFPINGLRGDGQCNEEGVRLVPRSMQGGVDNACAGLTLGVENNKLVGRKANGLVGRCQGDKLAGASFEVRSWAPADSPTKKSVRILVKDIVPYTDNVNGEIRTGYRLVQDVPKDKQKTLCGPDGAQALRSDLGLDSVNGLVPSRGNRRAVRHADMGVNDDVVIPVWSEMYESLGRPIEIGPKWRLQEREWLNLACVDDALAKRSLYRLYTDNFERSRAAIRMLTANYCGNRPMTVRGVEIDWDPPDPDQLESLWSSERATCLSKPRVLYKDEANPSKVPADLPDPLRKICNNAECQSIETWTAAAKICKNGSEEITLPSCERCEGQPCRRGPLASFVVLPPH